MEVKVGQVYEDRDKRMGGRTMIVDSVGKTHAVMRHPRMAHIKTRVRLDNLRKRWRPV